MNDAIKKAFELLAKNYAVYSEKNLKLVNKKGKLVFFSHNRMQRVLDRLYEIDKASGKPIRWYITKSRQQGSSVWCLGLVYMRTTMNSHHTALLLNYDDASAVNLGGRVERFYQNSMPLLKPKVRKMNREEMHFATPLAEFEKTGDVGLDSRIIISTADSANLGRSYTFNTVMMSEFSLWEKNGINVKDALISLNSSIPDDPDSFVVIETTPEGEGFAKEFWEDEDNGYRKIFISWIAEDEYRVQLNEEEYQSLELSEDKDSKFGNEVEERSYIIEQLKFWFPEKQEDLAFLDREAACRLVWRRSVISRKLGGKKEAFDSEYPTTIEKMFSGSSASIFGGFKISTLQNRIVSNNLKPSKYDFDDSPITDDPYRKFFESNSGKLLVYKEPEPYRRYVIGADCSQGIEGGDESSLVVLSVPRLEEVAMFSAIVRPDIFAEILHYLSIVYNKALVAPEVNDKGGYAAVQKMFLELKTPTLYKLDIDRPGWYTNKPIRSVMINDFKQLVEDDQITIRSKKIVDQMGTFIEHRNGKIAAKGGKKDDLVMAMMIAVQLASEVKIDDNQEKPRTVDKYSYEWFKARNAFRGTANQSSSLGFNVK